MAARAGQSTPCCRGLSGQPRTKYESKLGTLTRLRARRTTCAAVEFGIPVDGKDIAPITAAVPCMETPLLHVSFIPLHDRRQQKNIADDRVQNVGTSLTRPPPDL